MEFCNHKCPYVDHEPVAGATLRAAGPCTHLEEPTGALEDCRGCAGRVRLKVFQCHIHGPIVPDRVCQTCSDFEPRLTKGVFEIIPGLADPLPYFAVDAATGEWSNLPAVQNRFIEAFKRLCASDMPRMGVAAGDGIVICGGGNYWPMIAISLHMARRVTQLPIQVWHRGALEPVQPKDIRGLANISFHDATAIPNLRRQGGWETKSIAVIHCGFERVLFLDADAYLVGDPQPLLNLATPQRSMVFWKDFPNHWGMVNWQAFGLPREQIIGPIQGGQLAFHRPGAWKQLIVSHWLNQHSDYSYHHGYGDQDQWRVAWAGTSGTFLDLGEIPYHRPAFVGSIDSKPVVVHRVQDKLWGLANLHRCDALPGEAVLTEICDTLRHGTQGAGEVFAGIYARGEWAPVGTSGRGSRGFEAQCYLSVVNDLIDARGWKVGVDLGCGDGFIMKRLRLKKIFGADCVSITEPPSAEDMAKVSAELLDLDKDRDFLPEGEVAFIKDVLHHWPSQLVHEWLQWAVRCGKWKTLVITNDRKQDEGLDCPLGGYRGLDPSMWPLNAVPGIKLQAIFIHKAMCIVECAAVEGQTA